MTRIPPKGTPEYRDYWRDRHVLEDLQHRRDRLVKLVEDMPETGRTLFYRMTIQHLDKAIEAWGLGHAFSYT